VAGVVLALAIGGPAKSSPVSDYLIAEAPIVSAGGAPTASTGLEVSVCVIDLSALGNCFPPPAMNSIVFAADPAVAVTTVWLDPGALNFAEVAGRLTNGNLDQVQYWSTTVPASAGAGTILTELALLDGQVGPSGVDLAGYTIDRIGLRFDSVLLSTPPGNPGETDWNLSATLLFEGVITSTDGCKQGGWRSLHGPDDRAFKNQGDCIQFVNTGK
jgi:hypothetical protein